MKQCKQCGWQGNNYICPCCNTSIYLTGKSSEEEIKNEPDLFITL